MQTSNLGNGPFGVTVMDEETAGDLLEGLGYLYGAMGFTASDVSSVPSEDVLILAGLAAPRRKPVTKARRRVAAPAGSSTAPGSAMKSWLGPQYKKWGKAWRGRFNQAGGKVPARCPGGSKPEFGAERDRGRWICFEPKGGQPYQVWNEKAAKWEARLLQCPAGRGYGGDKGPRTPITECQKVAGGGLLKKVGKGIAKGAKKTAKVVTKVVTTPYKFVWDLQIKVLMKAALPLARVICKIPPAILQVGALAAGMSIADAIGKRQLFCKAVQIKKIADIRKLLPDMIKIAVKVAATSSVPGLGPALAVVKSIPGFSKVLSFAGPGGGVDADPIALLDSLTHGQMAAALAGVSDEDLLEGLGAWTTRDTGTAVLLAGLLAGVGYGLYTVRRG